MTNDLNTASFYRLPLTAYRLPLTAYRLPLTGTVKSSTILGRIDHFLAALIIQSSI
ncbi:hypothetical protein [Methylotuvimicrobium sp.]|uniref:hypothetical protein n=1 Tax=Methylotuvimicrobium sp. TaxID=2822413 RepID=UPI003D647C1C